MKLPLPALSAPLAKARQWFQEQSLSDQQRLRWLAGFLALVLLWLGVVNPVLTFRDRAAGALALKKIQSKLPSYLRLSCLQE